ncbi:fimbrial protein [Citrobacter sp. Cpo090]|uniref:fimbrial protein n=1 Tax=Citrobacter sp. Cpo090 TaxID=2985139 RepID=UPI001A306F2D|nr:fimbrial protein [Citrobacter sp. Cpo090]MDM2846642.1 fimbrial protein [Citrobacter sp. Cpo090]
MKLYICISMLFISFYSFGACRMNVGNNERIELNVEFEPVENTAEKSIALNFKNDFNCRLSSDNMNLHNNIKGNTYSVNGIRFNIDTVGTTGFPVTDLQYDVWSGKTNSVSSINKTMTLSFNYELSGRNTPSTKQESETLLIKDAFVINSEKCPIFGCWIFGSESNYNVDLNVSVKHRKTTCKFSSSDYFIKMEDVTVQELISGSKKRSGIENIVLQCNDINGLASNPVSVRIADGDWDADGSVLINTISSGGKNVGFKLFRGAESTSLHKNDSLLSISKYSSLSTEYTFPVSAEYVLLGGGKPTVGEISSKVIFRVDYQ